MLIKAVLEKNIEQVARLILDDSNIYKLDSHGNTALEVALHFMGREDDDYDYWMDISTLIINQCTTFEVESDFDDAEIALIKAVNKEDIVSVVKLIKAGMSLNFRDDYHLGYTALLSAVDRGLVEIAVLLITSGANLEAKPTSGGYSFTALSLAATAGEVRIAKELIKANANLESTIDYMGINTALIESISKCHFEIAEMLIEAGANVNACGRNPNHAPPSMVWDDNGNYLKTSSPLTLAITKENDHLVKILLEKGADPNLEIFKNKTPLSIAVDTDNSEIIRILVEHGAIL
jgi:ankyrin repeat protein